MEGALGERLKREFHLSFHPDVAIADLIYSEAGRAALKSLWNGYLDIARRHQLPFLATTPTRRANSERVLKSGMTHQIISDNVLFLKEIQSHAGMEMYVGGLMGCKGDAYTGSGALNEEDAYRFHSWQAEQFKEAGADFLFAGIMPVLSEAVGMARAMCSTGIPYIISFTIERNGLLIDGTSIHQAIETIDAATDVPPVCYMTNCVHPDIVYDALHRAFNDTDLVRKRFLGIQANTSPLSYAELDNAVDLKSSDPVALACNMMKLRQENGFRIFGGCCGTDYRHMEEVARLLTVGTDL